MRMKTRTAALLTLVSVFLLAQHAPKASIERLAWLAGCWSSSAGGVSITEQWMKPEGGLMLGMSRTVSGGKAVEFEFVQVREDGKGGLVFVAKPSGQAEASFPAVKVAEREIVFENHSHDFPQRIIYRSPSEDELVARVENLKGDRGVDFSYRRAACP